MSNAGMSAPGISPETPTPAEGAHWRALVVPIVASAALLVWNCWCAFVCITGGTLPILGIPVKGTPLLAAIWVSVVVPISQTAAWWVLTKVTGLRRRVAGDG